MNSSIAPTYTGIKLRLERILENLPTEKRFCFYNS